MDNNEHNNEDAGDGRGNIDGENQEPLQREEEEEENNGTIGDHESNPPAQPSAHTAVDSTNRDFCSCAGAKSTVGGSNGGDERRCPLCGKVIALIEQSSSGGTVQTNLSLGQAFANGLTFLPETPPEDNTSLVGEIVGNSRPQQRITVAEQSKTPVQGEWRFPTQVPAVSTLFKFFTTVRHPLGTNGLLVALYFVTPDLFQQAAFADWLEENMPYVATIGDEYSSQVENRPFHTENIKDHVDVRFQQLYGGQFRIANLPPHNRVPLTRIKSLNHFRTLPVPSPISKVFVQCLPAEPGEMSPAQDHLRMTLEVDGKTSRRMLVPIWLPRQTDQTDQT